MGNSVRISKDGNITAAAIKEQTSDGKWRVRLVFNRNREMGDMSMQEHLGGVRLCETEKDADEDVETFNRYLADVGAEEMMTVIMNECVVDTTLDVVALPRE